MTPRAAAIAALASGDGESMVSLVERAIRNSSKHRDTVLDPFGGSGTTMIAAERTGRHAVLVEIDPGYVDVSIRRWQDETGVAAVLDGEDRVFDDIAEFRCHRSRAGADERPVDCLRVG